MRAVADLDIADDLCARAEHDAAPNLGMAVAPILAGAPERDIVENRNIVLDHRGLPDHQAGGVIEEDATADRRRRMDVGLKHRRGAALQIIGKILATLLP